ncbi:MAG TPA: hypothetical protein VGH11_12330, partial [Jatrophihabitans sp.]
ELLFDPACTDVTGSFAGDYNDDLDVSYAETPVEQLPRAGTVWRRVVAIPPTATADGRYLIHLINLTGQPDTHWDSARNPPGDPGPGTLRIRRMGSELPRVRYADPDARPTLTDIEVSVEGDYVVASLPSMKLWQVVVIEAR